MAHPLHFPPTETYWSASKRRFRQIGLWIFAVWVFDNAMDHTVMYWRALSFADNLCHAIVTGEHGIYERPNGRNTQRLVSIDGSRPFGPGLSDIYRQAAAAGWKKCSL